MSWRVVWAVALFIACGLPLSAAQAGERPVVVATFSVLEDFARQVGGEHADVRGLVPVGAEVHEYELRPGDFQDLDAADVIIHNGYDLEQWMAQVEASTGADVSLVAVAEASGVETLPIVTGDFQGEPDPHLWMDPRAAKAYVGVIADVLSEIAPANESAYRSNAERYQTELAELHDALEEILNPIPEPDRTLITSEAAFLYFAAAYGFHHDGIWGTNAESEGTPRQLMRVIDVIESRKPRAVFWESTISSRYVEGVAGDTGVPVAGPLYVDSLGAAGSGATSYIEMMQRNAEVLVEALGDG